MNSASLKDTWNQDLQLPSNTGFKNHTILERICRYLPTQQDCFQVSFVDQSWRYAATNVLWETPIFKTCSSFTDFLAIINKEKRFSRNVKHLTLCIPDEPSPTTIFQPINKSEEARHCYSDNIMSRTEIIDHLINSCNQLQSLSLYGWNLLQCDYDKLYTRLPYLTKLQVIGCHDQLTRNLNFQLDNHLAKLSQLILDGQFPITMNFTKAIATKARQLTTLHLSLSSMSPPILNALCDERAPLNLQDLTLTHAIHISDAYIHKILGRFSGLYKFCVQGSQHLTTTVIKSGLAQCRHLQYFEIRQAKRGRQDKANGGNWELDGHGLRTLKLDNLWLDNETLDNIAFYCPYLSCLGLAHTGTDLTDLGIESLGKAALVHLTQLCLIDCPSVTSQSLIYLPIPSLFYLHLESLHQIEPVDIFEICLQAKEHALALDLSRPNLRQIRIVGHQNISASTIGAFASEHELDYSSGLAESSHHQVTLDQQAIHNISCSDEFNLVPYGRTLSSRQVVELSRKLQLPLKTFIDLLDGLKGEPQVCGPNPLNVGFLPQHSTLALSTGNLNPFPQQEQPTTPHPQQHHTLATSLSHQDPTPIPSFSEQQPTPTPSSSHKINSDITAPDTYQETKAIETDNDGFEIALGGWGNGSTVPTWIKGRSKKTAEKVVNAPSAARRTDINQWGPPKKILPWNSISPVASEYLEEQEKKAPFWNRSNDRALVVSTENIPAKSASSTQVSSRPASADMEPTEKINITQSYSTGSNESTDLSDDDGITLLTNNPAFASQPSARKNPARTSHGKNSKDMENTTGLSKMVPIANHKPSHATATKQKFSISKPPVSNTKPEPSASSKPTSLSHQGNIIRWNQFAGINKTTSAHTQPKKISPVATPTEDAHILVDTSDDTASTFHDTLFAPNKPSAWDELTECLMDITADSIHTSNPNDNITETILVNGDMQKNLAIADRTTPKPNLDELQDMNNCIPDPSSLVPAAELDLPDIRPPSSTPSISSAVLDGSTFCLEDTTNVAPTSSTSQVEQYAVRISIQVSGGIEILKVSDENDYEAVHAFCVKHNVLDNEEAILKAATERYLEKKVNYLFKVDKKGKKPKGSKKKRLD